MKNQGTSGWVVFLFTALVVLITGCAEQQTPSGRRDRVPISDPQMSLASSEIQVNSASAPAAPSPSAAREEQKSATAGRKIIYNARVDLVTEHLNTVDAALTRLVAAQNAFIADSEQTGTAGATRHGTWKVRVPVDAYDRFIKGVVALGELVSLKADSQDVTADYVDIDARRAAKQVEETRLLKHLAETTGKLEEILAVERELSRVRSEIEQMQGRLRAMADLAALATVTINVSEIKGYVPPQAPTFATRISRTFFASLNMLRELGEALVIGLVALAPWLPLLAVGLAVLLWAVRRWMRWVRSLLPRMAPLRGDRPSGTTV